MGVPQGLLIGSMVFLVTVETARDCPDISDEFETDLFAEDNTSYYADPNIDQLFTKIQRMINNLSTWSHLNRLIYPIKSILLILSPKSFTGPLLIITIDRTPFKISTTATCL